jgi:RNA polymerase-binding transcription factor
MPSTDALHAVARRLDERAAQLARDIAAAEARADDGAREVGDRKDEADANVRRLVGDAELERDLAELRAIAGARERIEAGSYGRCSDCGEPIGQDRLLAQPTAARCTACQSEVERRERQAR